MRNYTPGAMMAWNGIVKVVLMTNTGPKTLRLSSLGPLPKRANKVSVYLF